jgi:hypothetical protein
MFGSTPVRVQYEIIDTKRVWASFSYGGKEVEFKIFKSSRWTNRKWAEFYALFHAFYPDTNMYGYSILEKDGTYSYGVTPNQLMTILKQITKDVFRYVDQIFCTYPRMILDYCAWYRDAHTSTGDYAAWTQYLACKCILKSKLYDTNILWDVIPLKMIKNN